MSVLTPIREQVLFSEDFEAAKALVLEALNNAPYQDQDIKKMKVQVQYQIFSLAKLKFFVNNNILAHQHLKV